MLYIIKVTRRIDTVQPPGTTIIRPTDDSTAIDLGMIPRMMQFAIKTTVIYIDICFCMLMASR